jgi:peroxiredoxin
MKYTDLGIAVAVTFLTCVSSSLPNSAWAADDAAAEYDALQKAFGEKMSSVKDDDAARKAAYIEHATRLSDLAAAKTGQSAETALVDSAVYFHLGGETAKSEAAFNRARDHVSIWPAKLQFIRAAAFIDGKKEAGRAYAIGLLDEAAKSGSKVNDLSDVLREYGENDRAIALIDSYLKTSDNAEMKAQLARKRAAFAVSVGAPPIDFIAKVRQTGETLSLSELKGKVVLLDFWATWCGPCVGELPNVQKTYGEFHDKGFDIVGISLDDDLDALDKFIKEKVMPWPQVADGKGWEAEIGRLYNVNGIPFTVLVGRDGLIKAMDLRGDDLYLVVEKALREKV